MGKTEKRDDENVMRSSDTNEDSARVLITKRAIFFAFRDLVAEHDFGSVTASDIIARSGVSRSTFYRCFADKYDITNWAFKRFKNIRLQDQDQYYSFKTSLYAQLKHLSENREFFVAALRYRGQNALHDSMIETNEEYMVQCWREAHGTDPAPADGMAIRFSAAGCSYVIESWVLDGCTDSPDRVVTTILACIPHDILETLY